MNPCVVCGNRINPFRRSLAKYCSARCRYQQNRPVDLCLCGCGVFSREGSKYATESCRHRHNVRRRKQHGVFKPWKDTGQDVSAHEIDLLFERAKADKARLKWRAA